MTSIASLCEQLVRAYEAKGWPVRDNLNPPASESELQALGARSGLTLPDDVLDLYRWRNGVADEEAEVRLLFRDNAFISLERSLEERTNILRYYSSEPGLDLQACLPVAFFEGSTYAVTCGRHPYGDTTPHSVILIFQGLERHFLSVRSLLETCVAWVEHPSWTPYLFDPDHEREIWQRYNPGCPG